MFIVTEGIESMWSYHISNDDNPYYSLCGKEVMPTHLSLKSWGIESKHIPKSFCYDCWEKFVNKQ
jgi:hypothetical protein